MTSRRTVLAALGTAGVTSLAGCSTLPFRDRDTGADVSVPADAVEPVSWPDSPFPVAVPSIPEPHRERTRELLAEVPTDPSVPNGAIAEELRSDRERAGDRLVESVDESWPTDQLAEWRSRRNAAAAVQGAYRAATGEDDAATVTERRQTVRDELSSFVAAHEYRASTPAEAVLVHTPIEDLLADCRRYIRPAPAYPATPVADPFQAGDAVGNVERARATLSDAHRLREVYLTERSETPSQWDRLIETSDRLRYAVGRTRSSVEEFLEVDESPFDADLEGTAGRWLFSKASRRVTLLADGHESSRDDGDYATAIIEAGRALAAIDALRTTIEGIRDETYQEPATADAITRTAERVQEATAALAESEDRRLAALIGRPPFDTIEYLSHDLERGHTDATRVLGDLTWAELYARAVPAATAFVIERLE